jgi:hypothetical protein
MIPPQLKNVSKTGAAQISIDKNKTRLGRHDSF